MLGTIVGLLLILVLGVFSVFACIVSSKCSRYEGYERNDPDE